MNWGKGIITGMIVFMLFILSMCVYMFASPTDEYDHQYYEKGLNFNKDYDREQQVTKDHAQPSIQQIDSELVLRFTKPVKGKIAFVRPSNQKMDKSFKLETAEENIVEIPTTTLSTGQWQLVLEWETDHKSYLYQHEIYIK